MYVHIIIIRINVCVVVSSVLNVEDKPCPSLHVHVKAQHSCLWLQCLQITVEDTRTQTNPLQDCKNHIPTVF